MTKDELGKWGEDFASNFLLQNGYSLIERNVRFKKYEVDIIAEKNNELIVVEVKARNTAEIGEPWRAVTKSKQRQIITVADNYVQKNQIDKNVRFDIISKRDFDSVIFRKLEKKYAIKYFIYNFFDSVYCRKSRITHCFWLVWSSR